MNKENLKSLKNLLPHGSIKKIAHQTNMSEQSVSKVLEGYWSNDNILKVAVALLQKEYQAIGQFLEIVTEEEEVKYLITA